MNKFVARITDSAFARTQGKTVLAWAIPTTIIYLTMIFWLIPELERFSGGMKILDMLPTGYDTAYVRTLFDALGPDGRSFYLYRQIPLDLLYPGLMAVTGALLLTWLLKKVSSASARYRWLVLFPVLGGVCDYGENIGVIVLLSSYPDLSGASVTSAFTLLKSLFSTLFFVAVVAGTATAIVRRLRNRAATV